MKNIMSLSTLSCLILGFAYSNQIIPMARALVSRPSYNTNVSRQRSILAPMITTVVRAYGINPYTGEVSTGDPAQIIKAQAEGTPFHSGHLPPLSTNQNHYSAPRAITNMHAINNALEVLKKHGCVLQLHIDKNYIDKDGKVHKCIENAFDELYLSDVPVESNEITPESVIKRKEKRDKKIQESADDSCTIL